MKRYYDLKSVEDAIDNLLIPRGYEVVTIPGVLIDTYICIAPNDGMYNIIFRAEYLNEWSSAYTVRNYSKLPKWATEAIREVESEVYA